MPLAQGRISKQVWLFIYNNPFMWSARALGAFRKNVLRCHWGPPDGTTNWICLKFPRSPTQPTRSQLESANSASLSDEFFFDIETSRELDSSWPGVYCGRLDWEMQCNTWWWKESLLSNLKVYRFKKSCKFQTKTRRASSEPPVNKIKISAWNTGNSVVYTFVAKHKLSAFLEGLSKAVCGS